MARRRSEFGARLEEAIKKPGRPGSIRRFQEALEDRVGGRERFGYSYPTINSYLTGDAAPTLDWIREVAELLTVPASWLAFGESRAERQESPLAARLPGWDEYPEVVQRLFTITWPRYMDSLAPPDGSALTLERGYELAADLNMFLRVPLAFFGPLRTERQREDFGMAMLNALTLAMPQPGEGLAWEVRFPEGRDATDIRRELLLSAVGTDEPPKAAHS